MTEAALYAPVARFWTERGFTVQAEVKDCDVLAMRGEEMVVVELKTSFQLKLVYQIVERQKFCPLVYAAIPRPAAGAKGASYRHMTALLQRLGAGLLLVALDSPVPFAEMAFAAVPSDQKLAPGRKKAVRKEVDGRSGSWNTGGVTRKKLLTAYREKALEYYPYTGSERQEGRVYLEDYFDPESIEIDKILYLGLAHRIGFIWLKDPQKEEKRTREYLTLAFKRFAERAERDGIKSFAEYDAKYSIHYFCKDWMRRLLALLEENGSEEDFWAVREMMDRMG